MSAPFEWTSIHGTKCILWLFHTNSEDLKNPEKNALKKQKEALGETHHEVPIVDYCNNDGSRIYCDFLVCTDNLMHWKSVFKEFYSNCKQIVSKQQGLNSKMVIRNETDTEDFLVIHFYPRKSKFMVQPGMSNEQNLLKCLADFESLKQTVCNLFTDGKNPETECNSATLCENNEDSFSSVRAGNDCDPKEEATSLQSSCSKLVVSLPPLASNCASNTESRMTSDMSSQTDCDIIIDELLFFLQNKLSVKPLTLNMLTRLCANFYTDDVISSSKRLLFQKINQDRFRLIKRRGEDKKEDDVMDMCKLMLSTEPAQMPTFVARDLLNIPCVANSDMCDSVKICRDLEAVKNTINQLSENQESLAKLVHATWTTGGTDTIKTLPPNHTVHTQCDPSDFLQSPPRNQPVTSTDPLSNQDNSPRVRTVHEQVPRASVPDSHRQDAGAVRNRSSSLSRGTVPSHAPPTTSRIQNPDACHNNRAMDDTASRRDSTTHPRIDNTRTESSENRNPWHVQRNRRFRHKSDKSLAGNAHTEQSKFLIGRGKSSGLHAVSHSSPPVHSKMSMTGTFISKLHPRTTSAQLAVYILREFGLTVRPEKLSKKSQLQFYSSFYIPCNHNQRRLLMNADLWPTGTLVKPFLQ